MKSFYSVLFFLFHFVSLHSQIHFENKLIFKNELNHPKHLVVADLNQDNKVDLLVAVGGDNKICWYKNLVNGSFEGPITISTNALNAYSVFAADLDGDSLVDALSASGDDDKIAWYKNLGNGNFGSQQVITTQADEARCVIASDLDGDNDFDVISASMLDNKVAWYENDGIGNFGPQQIISNTELYASQAIALDFDLDGNIDIISKSVLNGTITWYRNLGNGIIGTPIVITNSFSGIDRISVADLDGDGDKDIIGLKAYTPFQLAWIENFSNTSFGPIQVINNSTRYSNMIAKDIDHDTDIDIIAIPLHLYDSLTVFKNDGSGNFVRHPIDRIVSGKGIYYGDFNADNLLDIAVTYDEGDLSVFINDSTFSLPTRHDITVSFGIPHHLDVGDLNADGLCDIIASSYEGNKIVWFENMGNNNFGEIQVVDQTFQYPTVIQNDLNNDGAPDLIASDKTGNQLAWFENNGSGSFGQMNIISDTLELVSTIEVVDMNNDGYKDIIAASNQFYAPNHITLLKNNGANIFNEVSFLAEDSSGRADIVVVDLDDDGDLDLVNAEEYVVWMENDGNNVFTHHTIIGGGLGTIEEIFVGDLNGDSLLDIAAVSCYYGGVGRLDWWPNDGTCGFSSYNFISMLDGTKNLIGTDIDKDGDIDLTVNLNYYLNSIQIFKNDGLGNFFTGEAVCDTTLVPDIAHYDMDNDSDFDFVYSNRYNEAAIYLAINKGYAMNHKDSACANQPYSFGNQLLVNPGIYIDTLQSIYGLDSIVELEFSHIPIPTVSLAPFPQDSFCIQDDTIGFPLAIPLSGEYFGPGVTSTNINLQLADTGTHQLTYQYTDTTTGCSNSDTVDFVVIDCLTIPEAEQLGISVYPNPACDFVVISLQGTDYKSAPAQLSTPETEIRLFDAMAKLVLEESTASFPFRLSLENLKPGMYYLQIYDGETTVVYKVVKR